MRVLGLPHPHPAPRPRRHPRPGHHRATAAAKAPATAGGERDRRSGRATTRREPPVTRRREVSYQWRLREIMASRGLFTTTHLAPLLAERGIMLSASQIHRLVTGTPERLSLPVLAALCDLLEVTPAELIVTSAENATTRKTAAATGPAPVAGPAELRPDPRPAASRAVTRPRQRPTTSTTTRTTTRRHVDHGRHASRVPPPRSDRWTCARCGRDHSAYRCWPEGHLCRTCVLAAVDIHGVCPGCGDQRILPGRGPTAPRSARPAPGSSTACSAAAAARAKDGSTTANSASTAPSPTGSRRCSTTAPATPTQPWPRSPPRWRPARHPPRPGAWSGWPGRTTATCCAPSPPGRLPLTHDGLTAYPDQAGIPYLRALLVHCGALPDLDRQLLDFEAWLTRRLHGLAEHPHERLLRQFGLWHQLPRMRTKAALPAADPARPDLRPTGVHPRHRVLHLARRAPPPPHRARPARPRPLLHRTEDRAPPIPTRIPELGHDQPQPPHADLRPDPVHHRRSTHPDPPPRPATPPHHRPRRRRRTTGRCGCASRPVSCCSTPSPSPAS